METFKQIVDIAGQIIATGAIVVGGLWTYRLFVRQRTGVARANLTQTLHKIPLTETHALVRLDLAVENIGSTPVRPRTAEAFVYGLRPIADTALVKLNSVRPAQGETDDTLDWPELAMRDMNLQEEDFSVEPGETAHLWVDFVIPAHTETYQVYSRVDCGKEYGDLFWDITSVAGKGVVPSTQQ